MCCLSPSFSHLRLQSINRVVQLPVYMIYKFYDVYKSLHYLQLPLCALTCFLLSFEYVNKQGQTFSDYNINLSWLKILYHFKQAFTRQQFQPQTAWALSILYLSNFYSIFSTVHAEVAISSGKREPAWSSKGKANTDGMDKNKNRVLMKDAKQLGHVTWNVFTVIGPWWRMQRRPGSWLNW